MRNICDPTEHELVVEARELVRRLNSEVEGLPFKGSHRWLGFPLVARAGVDGPKIILEVRNRHEWNTRELYTRIQKLIDSERFTVRLSDITVTENLDDYLPHYEVREDVF